MQRPVFPDVSWQSHSWKLMVRKLSKHKTNKEIFTQHEISLVEEHIAVKILGEAQGFFRDDGISCLQASNRKWKNSSPHINTKELTTVARDPIFSNLFPPHPSLRTHHDTIYWNTTLIRTKTVFFLSLFVSTWQGPLCKIMKYFQLTPHSFHWILL